MTIGKLYNNLGIESLAIMFVLKEAKSLPISKALLILPIVTHRELLGYLSRKNTNIQGLEKLIIEKVSFFSNFNARFYGNLCATINAIQFLHEIEVIELIDGNIKLKSEIPFDNEMGQRATQLQNAASNVAAILSTPLENLYLNLRVEL